jgi:hypothetical protein
MLPNLDRLYVADVGTLTESGKRGHDEVSGNTDYENFGPFDEMFSKNGKVYDMKKKEGVPWLSAAKFFWQRESDETVDLSRSVWIRICGKNAHGMGSDTDKRRLHEWNGAVRAIADELERRFGDPAAHIGVLFDGDNYEAGQPNAEGVLTPVSPFSVLIGEMLRRGAKVVAVKNARNKKVSGNFYFGWQNLAEEVRAAGKHAEMYMLFAEEAEKEEVSLMNAEYCLFLGSGLQDYKYKADKEGQRVESRDNESQGYRDLMKVLDSGFKEVEGFAAKGIDEPGSLLLYRHT